jgi:hypothetical protein
MNRCAALDGASGRPVERLWLSRRECWYENANREKQEDNPQLIQTIRVKMIAMRILAAIFVLLISAAGARATTLQDFDARTPAEQSATVANYIDKMTTDLRAKNPQLAGDIRNWFAVKAAGKPVSEGMERLYVELTAIDLQARDGKADLSKIQLENVIVYVVKQKFPPPAQAAAGKN